MKQLIIIILSLTISGCCAIVGLYPSHEGRVVDLSTKEPIQGAAVLAIYNTSGLDHTEREDAIEIVTDKNGHFKIPWNLIFTFRFLGGWDDSPQIFIYKPGYGCFPRYIKERVIRDSNGAELHGDLPAGIPVTIELDKLTPEELKWKSSCFTHGVPYEKMREMQKLEYMEQVARGLWENQYHVQLFKSQPDLFMAIEHNDPKYTKRLISKGCDINSGLYTPLMYAAERGRLVIADILISRGALINAQDGQGKSPLTVALQHPQIENDRLVVNGVVRLLIDKKADVNLAEKWGATPLSIASSNGYVDIVELLLRKGASVSVRGDKGRTVLAVAKGKDAERIRELLRSYGAQD